MGQRGTFSNLLVIGLRFTGLWPGSPYAAVNGSLYILSLLVSQYFLYSYAVLHFDARNIPHLIDCLSVAIAYTLLTLKLLNLWYNRRIVHDILHVVENDWKEASIDATNRSVMAQKAELSRRSTNILVGFNALCALLYVLGDYAIQSMRSDNATREFPVRMVFPFDVSATPIFELAVLVQFLHQVTVATLVASINAFILTLILHVSGQIDIACETVRELTSKSFESMNTIRTFVQQHKKIIDFANHINDVFSIIALLEFLCDTIVICCIGSAIIASLGTEDALIMMTKCITFYVAITMEVFIFCYGGEYLAAKSKCIGDAVYETLWYNLRPRECEILSFIILRSQKRLTITAGNLMDMSLETFTRIMKASASYISVLHAMY